MLRDNNVYTCLQSRLAKASASEPSRIEFCGYVFAGIFTRHQLTSERPRLLAATSQRAYLEDDICAVRIGERELLRSGPKRAFDSESNLYGDLIESRSTIRTEIVWGRLPIRSIQQGCITWLAQFFNMQGKLWSKVTSAVLATVD